MSRRRRAARKPTYGAASRLARLVMTLHERPHGWSFAAVQDALGISERTLLRYLAVARETLVDPAGRPLLEAVRHGDRRIVRLADHGRLPDSTVYEVLSFYFALSVFTFLDGTVIRQGIEGLWDRLRRTLPGRQRDRLADFHRKFYAVPHAMKDYREADELLDTILRCVIDNRRMRVDYAGLLGGGRTHEFEPYTLLMYRGGLYVLGRSDRGRKLIPLAVERMRAVTMLPETFTRPPGYSPQKHTEGIFGLIDGPETTVELLIKDPETHAYLAARRLHPSQQFRARRDGSWVLTLTVRGVAELRYWILGLGPHVEVLRPAALREEIGSMLARAAAPYRATARAAAARPARGRVARARARRSADPA